MKTKIKLLTVRMILTMMIVCFGPTLGAGAELTFELFYQFDPTNSAHPYAGLVQGSDGNFYGTTYGDTARVGDPDAGTVFKISPSGALTALFSFSVTNGSNPRSTLVQGSDGNFYGTTLTGGTNSDINGYGFGTVFKVTTNGLLTSLYSFNGTNGSNPRAGLAQGSDGNFYGTTAGGGTGFSGYASDGSGTVFRITPDGALTTLLYFSGPNGASPQAALLQGGDGNFYGTAGGGTSGNGTVFKITTNGVLTTVASFSGSDGAGPKGGFAQGRDGNFYGTTVLGGANGLGTVFKVSPSGALTTLLSFNGTNGAYPHGLGQGRDGNFYGTTSNGGANGRGTVFEITPAGELSTLVSFDGTNGIYPEAALVQGSDGNFYGTTPDTLVGGAFGGGGTIFRLIQPLSLRIALGFRGASVQLSWNSSSNRLYQVQYVNDLSTTNWLNYGPILYATGPVTALDVPTFGLQQRYFRVALLP